MITVYGTKTCAFCKTERQWLDSLNVKYEYIDIEEDNNAMQYLITSLGSSAVPVTKFSIQDEEDYIVKGFNRQALSERIKLHDSRV